MKSLKFFKPTLATTLAIVLAWLLSVRPAQAGYTVTLQQVGPDVVATGSGAIDLTGLTFSQSFSINPGINPHWRSAQGASFILTGPTSSSINFYFGATGPTSFGGGHERSASSGSGDMVGITADFWGDAHVIVPTGYVSGTALSDTATYSGKTFAQLGVTPGTYVWKWGTGANQNFTLKTLPAIPPATNITSISTRALVQTGQGVTIVGFAVTGTDPKQVVIRGLGPTLANYNVTGVLADLTLQLFDGSGHPMWFNDNWKDTQQAQIQATGLAPTNDLESAILQILQPGNYTAILSGKSGATGVGLVEVYDISSGVVAELTNVSTRGFVGSGESVMIGGFITSGGSTQVVVRGLGPTLTQFGVSGALADPVVTLVDGNGMVVKTNDNWKNTQQVAIQATGLAPPNDLESAMVVTVAAGNYTAILSGQGGGTGIGLVEVYKL
ncbi:MAG TPA: hypothetical protein VK639_07615 [Terriglobales bacterium]|nr:hypothetical protein [Terriglobales bacterium]